MTREDFIKILSTEFILNGVPDGCLFSDINVRYKEDAIAINVVVARGNQGYGGGRMFSFSEMDNFRDPIAIIGEIVSAFKKGLIESMPPPEESGKLVLLN